MKLSLVHWLIAAAVLANAAAFFWQQMQSAPETLTEARGLRELKLLSELEDERPASTAAVSEVAFSDEPLEPALSPGNPEISDALADAADPALQPPDVDIDDRAQAPASPPRTTAAASDQLGSASPQAAAPQRCWLAGPVTTDALSEQLTVAFAAAGVSMDLVLQTTEVSPDNWIYLPTSGEQADVRRLSRELRQDGIDNFPINSGSLAGSLSLGLFRSEQRAIAVRDSLRSRGYQAEIHKRQAFAEQPWINLDEAGRVALDWPAQEGELPGYDNLRLLNVECLPES